MTFNYHKEHIGHPFPVDTSCIQPEMRTWSSYTVLHQDALKYVCACLHMDSIRALAIFA